MKKISLLIATVFLLIGLIIYLGIQPVTDTMIEREYASAKPWPNAPYKTVKAYLYNLQHDDHSAVIPDPDILKNGQLVPSVVNREGIVLSPSQIQRLIEAISQVPIHHNGALIITFSLCMFDPHHAFVFYDSSDKMVGTVEICTLCEDVQVNPERKLDYRHDFKEIDSLIEELGLPVFHEDEDVTAYRNRH